MELPSIPLLPARLMESTAVTDWPRLVVGEAILPPIRVLIGLQLRKLRKSIFQAELTSRWDVTHGHARWSCLGGEKVSCSLSWKELLELSGLSRRQASPVTIGAGGRGGLIEDDRRSIHLLHPGMTHAAADVPVSTGQRELRSLFVVKERRAPFRRVVALGAVGGFIGRRELRRMRVLVAFFAFLRGAPEIDVGQFEIEIRRPVALCTTRGAMCSCQFKRRR